MSADASQLEAAIAALEGQRVLLGDAVVDVALGPLRERLAALAASGTASADEPVQALKQVAILFLDIVESTRLSQHLDPEQISALMDGALARFTAVVDGHGGKVLQYAGDSLLAAFGADESREDDAERAVLCGLALLAEARTQDSGLPATQRAEGMDVRIGLHTGNVLLGGGVDADGAIRGAAVAIAARMEHLAPPGALCISHDTYTQVRGMFEVQAQAPPDDARRGAAAESYLVLRAKPRAFRIRSRGIEGVVTHMIGRDAELETLQAAFRRLYVERRFAAITVVAEAGLGKSRLLYEFAAWAETRPETFLLFRGRAHPHTQGQPYGLLRSVLAWRLQIADDDTLDAAKAKLEQAVVPLFAGDDGADAAEGHAHLLGHLVGLDYGDSRHVRGIRNDPKQIRNRAFHAAAQLFQRLAARREAPVVLELEDLHWADDASLDFLDYLAQVNREVPMLVLGLARPTLFERRPEWKLSDGPYRRIELGPLDKGHSRDLARELLQRLPEVPAALRELVTGGAAGNPFYMEELVRMLIDQGALETHGPLSERWTVHADRLLATHVPPTLTGVLQARLDGLPKPEKQALQEASVIGQVFWDQALLAIDPRAGEALPALVRRELALPRADGARDGLREYAFRHQILHQVTYQTVLKRTRRTLHGRLAAWLATLGGARASDFLAVTAEHYEKAGDAAHAAEYHARAAEHAQERFAHDTALAHVGRGLALLEGLPGADPALLRLHWRLRVVREDTHEVQGRRAEQAEDIDALASIADALDDDDLRARVALTCSYHATRAADWPAGEALAQAAADLAGRAGDVALRLTAQSRVARARANQGDPATGRQLAQQGLAEARERGLRTNEAQFLNLLMLIAEREGDLMESLALTQQALAIDRETGNRRSEAIELGNLGSSWLNLGRFAQAQADLEEALRRVRANGDRVSECPALCNLSTLARWQGDDARALALAQSALDRAILAEARVWEVFARLCLGDAELALGRHASAAQAFALAHAQATESGDPEARQALAGLARVAMAQGDTAAALQQVEALTAHLDGGGTLEGTEWPRQIELTCHQVLAHAGDPRAGAWLQRAHEGLHAQAAAITDPALRRAYLDHIPHHREIATAWAAWRRASAPPATPATVGPA